MGGSAWEKRGIRGGSNKGEGKGKGCGKRGKGRDSHRPKVRVHVGFTPPKCKKAKLVD